MDNTPKLQILVPQYKETEDDIKPLLDSIAIQKRIDFAKDVSVIIVNDGSDVQLGHKFLDQYNFAIMYVTAPHRGVSATRNTAMDLATADYIMWCDADDMFYISHALWLILRDIKNGFDMLNSVFVEEVYDPKTEQLYDLIKREHDRTFVHGKVYRRQYLIDNKIRWNENLHIHEDVYFTSLAMMSTSNIKYQETFFYLWRYRKESICRNDPKYNLKTYTNLLDTNDALIDALLERENLSNAMYLICFVAFDLYYSLQMPVWHEEENKNYRDQTEQRFAELWRKHKKLFMDAPADQKYKTGNGIRERMVSTGMRLEVISFWDWIEHIEELQY